MNIDPTVTIGQLLPYLAALITIIGGAALTFLVNKVKKALIVEWRKMVAEFKTETKRSIDESSKALDDKIDEENAKLLIQIADTNRRVSDLAAGASELKTDLRTFKEHVTRHYVEKDEIAALKSSIDKALDRIESGFELATATMSDVRDSVIALTAKSGKPTVPPRRSAAAKTTTGA